MVLHSRVPYPEWRLLPDSSGLAKHPAPIFFTRMRFLTELFENNRLWAERMRAEKPEFFEEISAHQKPKYLWIGCSDSRVPANQIVDLPPGKMFVHRNIANLCLHTDMNLLSVLQYGVEVLGVEHIVVCGHYGCGGVRAALDDAHLGLIDNWLRCVRETSRKHSHDMATLPDEAARFARLCELNVIQQINNLRENTIVQSAWAAGHPLTLHGWIYDLHSGLLRDLAVSTDTPSLSS